MDGNHQDTTFRHRMHMEDKNMYRPHILLPCFPIYQTHHAKFRTKQMACWLRGECLMANEGLHSPVMLAGRDEQSTRGKSVAPREFPSLQTRRKSFHNSLLASATIFDIKAPLVYLPSLTSLDLFPFTFLTAPPFLLSGHPLPFILLIPRMQMVVGAYSTEKVTLEVRTSRRLKLLRGGNCGNLLTGMLPICFRRPFKLAMGDPIQLDV